MGDVLLPLALICCFSGIFLALPAALRKSGLARRASLVSLLIAWLLHAGAIVHEGLSRGYFPLTSQGEYLLVLSWLALTVHLLVWRRFRLDQTALILPPLAALMGFAALVLLRDTRAVLPDRQVRGWFVFHVSISALGMAALCLAFGMSVIYLLQNRALKAKRGPSLLARLPSLEACDRLGYIAVLWGLPLLTVGIVTGEVLSWVTRDTLWIGGAKQIAPLLAWGVLAILVYARLVRGLGGRRSAYLTIAGFTLGLLTVFGMTR